MDPSSALTYSTPMAPSLSTSSSIITPYHLPLLTMSHYSGLYTTTSTTTTSSTTSSVPFLIGASSHYLVTRSSSIEQKQSTLTHLNMTSQLLSHLFEPTNVSSVPMSSDIGYTAKSAMSQLENQTEEISLLDNLDTSLYLSVSQNVLVSVILGAIMVFTIIGNLMVIWAIFNYRPLHNVQNMFLVSLAVSDIAVAVLVMPFNVAYNLLGKWIFGLHICEMWLTSDV
ncbi:hypothetical protein RDWZM_003019 [Blomia tropicalis]|uniref:G-protein coupled receptors family 1 profile domain-containing protein n=1 Tax=Blomia tropicalis TaxID=40697 RepID=A0A9Q0MEV4_BLOTA|nr:hypothetical protein RDWZM_003019 [Blomia tropicalis]